MARGYCYSIILFANLSSYYSTITLATYFPLAVVTDKM